MTEKVNDKNLINQVEEVLTQLRPYLHADGGDINLVEVSKDNVVKVELLGACKSCSMSMMTLKAGVEEALKRSVPSIVRVEAVNP